MPFLCFSTQINLGHQFKMSAFRQTHVQSCVCHWSVDTSILCVQCCAKTFIFFTGTGRNE